VDAGDVGWQATQSGQGCRAKATPGLDYIALVISGSRFVALFLESFGPLPEAEETPCLDRGGGTCWKIPLRQKAYM
jgi:hypothetical protein